MCKEINEVLLSLEFWEINDTLSIHPMYLYNVTCICIGNQYTCHVSSYQITFSANLNLYLC